MDFDRRRRERRSPLVTAFLHDAKHDPYLSLAAALGFGALAAFSDAVPWNVVFLAPAVLFLCRSVRQFSRWEPLRRGWRAGGEKLLLVTIMGAGGSVTVVEAALATSLTVDEAEGILSRLAERGHLRVEVRDGTLHFALPETSPKGPLEN